MASPRQSGLYGALYLHVNTVPALASVRKVADTFNLSFDTDVEMLPCSRKGDGFARFMPGGGVSRISGEAHFQNLATMLALANDDLTAPVSGTPYLRVAFKLVVNDGGQDANEMLGSSTALPAYDLPTAGQQVIEGFGWMARATLNLPSDDAITQPFEIQVDGEWEFKVTT